MGATIDSLIRDFSWAVTGALQEYAAVRSGVPCPASLLKNAASARQAFPGGRYFDVSLAWSPRPIWRAASRIVTSLFRVTSVVNTPFKSTSIVNTQIPVV